MTATRATPPGIVLGTGLTALGVIRSLADAGVPALCLSESPDFETHSRWYHAHNERLGAFASAAELAAVLERAPWPGGVLMPCSDHWAVEVAQLPEPLRSRFRASVSAPDVVASLIDKSRFRGQLERAGVAHPFTAPIRDEAHLIALLESSPPEVFLKPVDSQRFVQAFGVKAFHVSGREAATHYRRAREKGVDMVLQEYIPGRSDHHVFVDGFVRRDHTLAAVFARRRLRMHPPDFGNSSCVVSIDPGEVGDAVESLSRLFASTGYRGIFSAEFKLDTRDNLHKLLEVNCRPWWYVDFSTQCGINVVAMAYEDALDRPVRAVGPPRTGIHLVYGYYDLHACRRMVREGTLRPGEFLRQWLVAERAVFRWADPMPALAILGRRVRDGIGARLRPRGVSSVP